MGDVLLEGHAGDVSLPEIFRLLKMSRKTGVLKVSSDGQGGEVYFCDGQVYYATSTVCGAPLGERLVRSGILRPSELVAALEDQRSLDPSPPLATVIRQTDLVSDDTLSRLVREQIEDCAFTLFNWPQAEFHFVQIDRPPSGDIIVSLDAEGVIMEGSRLVDEWTEMMRAIGSLEKVPSLLAPTVAGKISLRTKEWGVICYVDGHRDINTMVAESGLGRVETVRTVYALLKAGLLAVRDPALELLGQRVAISILGPIDIYNRTFLTTVCDSDISNHLRLEIIDGEEVEVRMSAGIREDEGESQLFYFCEARTPRSILRRMALETSAFIVLVNVNSRDSVLASRGDVALLTEMGDRPWVAVAYASIADEAITLDDVRTLLGIPERTPVLSSGLRDPRDAAEVVGAVLRLVP